MRKASRYLSCSLPQLEQRGCAAAAVTGGAPGYTEQAHPCHSHHHHHGRVRGRVISPVWPSQHSFGQAGFFEQLRVWKHRIGWDAGSGSTWLKCSVYFPHKASKVINTRIIRIIGFLKIVSHNFGGKSEDKNMMNYENEVELIKIKWP